MAARASRTTEHIHLLGIAGSAMAPVAGMLKERGLRVTGSDVNVYPPASTLLNSLGIPWNEGFREENLKPALISLLSAMRILAAIPRLNTFSTKKFLTARCRKLLRITSSPATHRLSSRALTEKPRRQPCWPGFFTLPDAAPIF